MFDLIENIENYDVVNETTTEDNVSFVPAQMGVVQHRLKSLSKKKTDWNLEVLEDMNKRAVMFEDQMAFIVPDEHWSVFQSIFGSEDLKTGSVVNLQRFLNESMEDELETLNNEVRPAIINLYESSIFDAADANIRRWMAFFKRSDHVPQSDVLVSFIDKQKQLAAVITGLKKAYGGEKGSLEMLLDALEQKDPLSTFEIFKRRTYLYGAKVSSFYEGVQLYFVSTIDPTYTLQEKVVIRSEGVAEELTVDMGNVRVVRDTIYPIGEQFSSSFFNLLRTALDDYTTDAVASMDEES